MRRGILGTIAAFVLWVAVLTVPVSAVPPPPPEAPVLSAEAGDQVVSLSWTASDMAVGYQVYRYDAVEMDFLEIADVVSGLTYEDTGLQNGTEYRYFVVAYDGQPEPQSSENSNEVGATPFRIYSVDQPTGLTAKAAESQVALSWSKVQGADGYTVYLYNSTTKTDDVLADTVKTAFTHQKIPNGVTYRYRVKAYVLDDAKQRVYSVASTSVTAKPAVVLPQAPQQLRATGATDSSISLAWNRVKEADGYYIYIYDSTAGAYQKVAETTASTYTHKGRSRGMNYAYRVKAYRVVDGKKHVSGSYSAKVTKAAVALTAAPKGVKATATDSSATLTWNSVKNADGYRIYVYNAKTKTYVKLADTKNTSYTHKNVKKLTQNSYRVKSYRYLRGVKFLSEKDSSTVKVTILKRPGVPSKVTAQAAESQVTISWNKVSGATGYLVSLYNTSSKTYKGICLTKNTSYTHKGLKNGTTYQYKIRPYRKIGGTYYYSAGYSAMVAAKPDVKRTDRPVRVLTTRLSDTKVRLDWGAVSGAAGYRVYLYDAKQKKYVPLQDVTGTSYTHTGLQSGSLYQFCVRSYRVVNHVKYVSVKSRGVTYDVKAVNNAVRNVKTMSYPSWANYATTLYADKGLTQKIGSLSAGQSVTCVNRNFFRSAQVKTKDGKTGWVAYNSISFGSGNYTQAGDYTKAEKEAFMNGQGYNSSSKYLIWISLRRQKLYLFEWSVTKWRLTRTCTVSTGRNTAPTPTGTFTAYAKLNGWFYSNTYIKPVIYFLDGGYAMHSREHYYDGTLVSDAIGMPLSAGCVRMYNQDINFLYNNVPIGTSVVIF